LTFTSIQMYIERRLRFCKPADLLTLAGCWGVHNLFATAGRISFIFMNYGASEFRLLLFCALLLFCFRTSTVYFLSILIK